MPLIAGRIPREDRPPSRDRQIALLFIPLDLDFLHLCIPRPVPVRRMLAPTQKLRGRPEFRNYRNGTRDDENSGDDDGDGDDDDVRRRGSSKGGKKEKEGEKKVSLDEGDKRGRSSCFVWSRPMYNAKFDL